MEIIFSYRATFSEMARSTLERDAKRSFETFFRHYDGSFTAELKVFRACVSNVSQSLMKIVKPSTNFGHSPVGVPVHLSTEGTQALECLLVVRGKSDEETRQILSHGPYRKKKKNQKPEVEAVTHVDAPKDTQPEAVPAEASDLAATEGSVARNQIDAELVKTGVPQHDLECLRAFYLELADNHFGGAKDGEVFVDNVDISALMEQAFKLPKTLGQFGAVYSARIRPFAESLVPQGGVRGWKFKVQKVLTFIEGSKIPRMANNHPHVINVPMKGGGAGVSIEGVHGVDKAPTIPLDDVPVTLVTGKDIEEKIDREVVSSFDLIAMVALLMDNRGSALAELGRAEEEKQAIASEVADLEAVLAIKKAELEQVSCSVTSLQSKVDSLQVSTLVWGKVKAARDELDRILQMSKSLV